MVKEVNNALLRVNATLYDIIEVNLRDKHTNHAFQTKQNVKAERVDSDILQEYHDTLPSTSSAVQENNHTEIKIEEAYSYMLTIHKKEHSYKKHKVKISLLSDTMEFKRATNSSNFKNKTFTYNQLGKYYVFKTDPLLLIIGAYDFEHISRGILAMHYKTVEEVKNVCDILDKQKSRSNDFDAISSHDSEINPFFREPELYHDKQETVHRSASQTVMDTNQIYYNYDKTESITSRNSSRHQEVIVPGHYHNHQRDRSISTISSSTLSHVTTIESEKNIRVVEVQKEPVHKQRHETHHHHNKEDRSKRIIIDSVEHTDLDGKKRVGRLFENECDDEWEITETYMEYNKSTGLRVVSTGPIYMYVAHQRHCHYYDSVFTCDSDNEYQDGKYVNTTKYFNGNNKLSNGY